MNSNCMRSVQTGQKNSDVSEKYEDNRVSSRKDNIRIRPQKKSVKKRKTRSGIAGNLENEYLKVMKLAGNLVERNPGAPYDQKRMIMILNIINQC